MHSSRCNHLAMGGHSYGSSCNRVTGRVRGDSRGHSVLDCSHHVVRHSRLSEHHVTLVVIDFNGRSVSDGSWDHSYGSSGNHLVVSTGCVEDDVVVRMDQVVGDSLRVVDHSRGPYELVVDDFGVVIDIW